MIIHRGGRSTSVRTPEEDDNLLRRDLESLSSEEREVLALMLSELGGQTAQSPDQPTLIDLVAEAEYIRQPVDMRTFVKDPYFLGNICESLYDRHMIDLEELFSGGYQEAIWTGAIGTGKTFVASVGVCRVLYELSCLHNPHKSYGLAPGSNISIVCLSVNEQLAMKVAFENIATKIKASPYFQEHFSFKETRKEFRFPNNVWLAARATTDTSALGLNVISSILDECLCSESLVTLGDGEEVPVTLLYERYGKDPFPVLAPTRGGRFMPHMAYVKPSSIQECFALHLDNGRVLRASWNEPVATHFTQTVGYSFTQLQDLDVGSIVLVSEGERRMRHNREARVVAKEPLGARPTYDIHVPTHGALIADGVLVHNTNFMDRGTKRNARDGVLDHAETIYTVLKRRMKSRFERRGKLPGMLFLVSSKKTTDDFTSRRISESRSDATVFVRDYATWDVKPDHYYHTGRFPVLCGNEQVLSRILEKEEADKLRPTLSDGVVIVDVPEDFRNDFERDIEGSIRDIAGISTVAISPFIQRREKLVFDPSRSHPFSSESYDPSKGGTFVWDRMVSMTQVRDFGGHWHEELRPIVNPHAPRHVHIDPSYRKDRTGFCMAHIFDWVDVLRKTEDGEVYQERAPLFYVDVVLQIIPPIGDEIVLGDIRRLVYDLSSHGYMITYVSVDTWNSVDTLQHLKRKGFRAEHLSVDTKTDPYEDLKTAFYEDRVRVYNYPELFRELRTLEKDEKKKKVEHPSKGSKDISDALAGCLYTLSQRRSSGPLPIVQGESFHPDSWMEEQRQAAAARQQGADSGRFFPEDLRSSGSQGSLLLPFLMGGSTGRDPRGDL